jgi:tRNA pseudouridine55 synthase
VSAKRGATDLSGVLLVDKPAGLTSHDVVGRIRRSTGERRVGHTGTLDPLATGLLVVLVGPATRLAPFLVSAEKTYEARFVFGTETDTDDADGRVTRQCSVPDEVADPFFASGTVASLVGTHEQMPPAYSAVKVDGRVAHRAARAGAPLELTARTIDVVSARLLGLSCETDVAWDLDLTVSKGTYIRVLARDVGRAVNCAAHLGALRRTRAGTADLKAAYRLEDLDSASAVRERFTDPCGVLDLPVVEVRADAPRVESGAPLPDTAVPQGLQQGSSVAIRSGERLLAVYRREGDVLKAQAVIPGGVAGCR